MLKASKYPLKNVLGSFLCYELGPLVPVTGMMNSEKYKPGIKGKEGIRVEKEIDIHS